MLLKYVVSLAFVVLLFSLGASTFQFATRSQVPSGTGADETWDLEFTLDADSSHTYQINPLLQRYLESGITFPVDGPVHIASSTLNITPKEVSWNEGRTKMTSTGGGLLAHVKWDTPANSANGARGHIYIQFPEISDIPADDLHFRSGSFQKDGDHYVLREVTTYQSSFSLSMARFAIAFAAGLPFGIAVHCIGWGFVLVRERKARLAVLPEQGPQLPRTFYPNPIVEWNLWTIFFGIGALVACMMAGISANEGFLSSTSAWAIYITLTVGAAVALLFMYLTQRGLLTVRVDKDGLSYAYGRGDLQWARANWGDILLLTEMSKTYRGSTRYWLELEFRDGRKKLKLAQDIVDYPALRAMLLQIFKPSQ